MFLDQLGHSGAGGLDADETLFSAAARELLSSREPGPLSPLIAFQPVGKTAAPPTPSGITFAAANMGFWVSWAQITDPDYLRTDIAIGTSTTVGPSNDGAIIFSATSRGVGANPAVFVYYPEDPAFTRYIWVKHVNRSLNATAWVYAGTFVNPGITDGYMHTNSISTDALWTNTINASFSSSNNTSQALSAGVKTLVDSVSCLHGSGCDLVEIWAQFKNVSGASKTMDVNIEDGVGTVYRALSNIVIPDNGLVFPFAKMVSPGGSATTVRLYVTITGGGTINNTVIFAEARRR